MIMSFFGWEGPFRWELHLPTRILEIEGNGALPDYSPVLGRLPRWMCFADQIREVRVGEGVTGVGLYGFYPYDHGAYGKRRPSLERAVLPSSLESIGHSAFRANTRLRSIDLGGLASLREIGPHAFSSCIRAREADLSGCANLEKVDGSAFWGCDGLAYVDLTGCFSLTDDALASLREGIPHHVPLVMPNGRILSAGDSPSGPDPMGCRILFSGAPKSALSDRRLDGTGEIAVVSTGRWRV